MSMFSKIIGIYDYTPCNCIEFLMKGSRTLLFQMDAGRVSAREEKITWHYFYLKIILDERTRNNKCE